MFYNQHYSKLSQRATPKRNSLTAAPPEFWYTVLVIQNISNSFSQTHNNNKNKCLKTHQKLDFKLWNILCLYQQIYLLFLNLNFFINFMNQDFSPRWTSRASTAFPGLSERSPNYFKKSFRFFKAFMLYHATLKQTNETYETIEFSIISNNWLFSANF